MALRKFPQGHNDASIAIEVPSGHRSTFFARVADVPPNKLEQLAKRKLAPA